MARLYVWATGKDLTAVRSETDALVGSAVIENVAKPVCVEPLA